MLSQEEDKVKRVLRVPKKMLEIINIYPEKQNKFTKLVIFFMILSVSFIELGQIEFLFSDVTFTEMASACTTVSTNFQSICKITIYLLNLNQMSSLLHRVRHDFWPIEVINKKKSLKRTCINSANLVTLNMFGILTSGLIFASYFLTIPLFAKNERCLPFAIVLPFNWTQSPIYEITYLHQVISNIFLVIMPICGQDFLFFALLLNTNVQFQMLKYVMKNIKNKNWIEVLKKCGKFPTNIDEEDYDLKVMNICIQHHQKLLIFAEDMEKVFSATVFVQYLSSISAICVSSFLISLVEKSSVLYLASFCVGHVFQLFMYCAVGNELVFHSSEVAIGAFQSNWYETSDMRLKKNIIFIIRRSQIEKKITALRFIDLDFDSFIKVLKLSFSFNALLNSINEQ